MQPKATAIVFTYWQSAKNISVPMENSNYWNLEYLAIEYFPVLLEDYKDTTDRPECESADDSGHFQDQVLRVRFRLQIAYLPG